MIPSSGGWCPKKRSDYFVRVASAVNEAAVAGSVNCMASVGGGIMKLLVFFARLPGWEGLSVCSRADRITHPPAGNHFCKQREGSHFCSLSINFINHKRSWIVPEERCLLCEAALKLHFFYLFIFWSVRKPRRLCIRSNDLHVPIVYWDTAGFQLVRCPWLSALWLWLRCPAAADMCHILCWLLDRRRDWVGQAGPLWSSRNLSWHFLAWTWWISNSSD